MKILHCDYCLRRTPKTHTYFGTWFRARIAIRFVGIGADAAADAKVIFALAGKTNVFWLSPPFELGAADRGGGTFVARRRGTDSVSWRESSAALSWSICTTLAGSTAPA
jgi:hypothetical protein